MLTRSHIALMRSREFCLLSGVIMCGDAKIKPDAECPTAYTDGWNCYYGEKFFSGLTEAERNAVVVHENFHKMLQQLTVWQKLFNDDPGLANRAADYVVNGMIEELDPKHVVTKLPESALLDPMFDGMNTKQVFDLLKQGQGKGKSKGGQGQGKGEPMDAHGWGAASNADAEEAEARSKQIESAIRQGAIIASKSGSGGSRVLTELLEPKVDWREQMRDFVSSVAKGKDQTTWRRPSRRGMARGVYLPSSYSEAVGDIVVAIDTSGSIGSEELAEFAGELYGICEQVRPESVRILWWDTDVCGEQLFAPNEYENLKDLLKPAGGGGTNFRCVVSYLRQMPAVPECLVVLTDGYVSDWGTPLSVPTLFGMTSNVTAPWGVSIKVRG
jgi:predicted metal-dependent peptidase